MILQIELRKELTSHEINTLVDFISTEHGDRIVSFSSDPCSDFLDVIVEGLVDDNE